MVNYTSGQIAGGWQATDISNQDVIINTKFALEQINSKLTQLGITQTYEYNRLISASSQVVAGMKYKVQFLVRKKNCNNQCVQSCSAVVYEQSWTNTRELLDYSCKPSM